MTSVTTDVRIDAVHWQQRLTELATKHRVPGASLGILVVGDAADGSDDVRIDAVHGVLSTATGVEVTTDSAFQIGSTGKVWTTTVVMQLVDEGKVDLDAPVRTYLPDLVISDEGVAASVTVRHLLTHTSGIDGDVFTDTGRGDDCLQKYVAALTEVPQNHRLGATFSYCNTGFVIAGRLIEVVTGVTWDEAIRTRITVPLGLTHTSTLPEDTIIGRAAVGHVGEPDEEPTPTTRWMLPRSLGPAGLISSTASELASFARMHLAGGLGTDGTRVLSAESVTLMQTRQVELPDVFTLGDAWGLGWILFGWDGHRLVGHDGNTIGQAAFLRVLPEAGLVVALLTNGGHTKDLYDELYREVFAELVQVAMPPALEPPHGADSESTDAESTDAESTDAESTDAGSATDSTTSVDHARYVGTYERTSVRTEVFEADGGLVLRTTSTAPLADDGKDPSHEYPLASVARDLFAIRAPGTVTWIPVTYDELDDGSAYLHYGARANPKTS